MLQLVTTTTINPNLDKVSSIYGGAHADVLLEKDLTPIDSVVEWSARTCYKSVDKFGNSPAFINKLIEMQHLDVLEHGYAGFILILDSYMQRKSTDVLDATLFRVQQSAPYLRIHRELIYGQQGIVYLSANMRVWREIMWNDTARIQLNSLFNLFGDKDDFCYLKYTLHSLSPNIFGDIIVSCEETTILRVQDDIEASRVIPYEAVSGLRLITGLGQNPEVLVLAFTPQLSPLQKHGFSITFQISNVSRAFTHQHVRHRLLSHSQESQRYVDASTNFSYVAPHSLSPTQQTLYDNEMVEIFECYKMLRNGGLRKEDARSVLPNSAKTKIISSAEKAGWEHYIKLRTAKDAQYEIRQVANRIKEAYDILRGVNY